MDQTSARWSCRSPVFINGSHTGTGAINIARAHVPVAAGQLASADFHTIRVARGAGRRERGRHEAVLPAATPTSRGSATSTRTCSTAIRASTSISRWSRRMRPRRWSAGRGSQSDHPGPGERQPPRRRPLPRKRRHRRLQPRHGNDSRDSPGTMRRPCGRGLERRELHPLGDIWLRSYSPRLANPSRSARSTTTPTTRCTSCPACRCARTATCARRGMTVAASGRTRGTDYYGECRRRTECRAPTSGSPPARRTGPTRRRSSRQSSATTPITRARGTRRTNVVGQASRGAAALRGPPLGRRAVVDGLDVVAVGVLDVGGVVAGVVLRPQARRPVVGPAGGERRSMERVDARGSAAWSAT